jgi:hypothetical protein
VAHEDLNVANVGSAFDKGGCETVSQLVRRNPSAERSLGDPTHAVPDRMACEWSASPPVEKYVRRAADGKRGHSLEIKLQRCDCRRAEEHEAVFPTLAVPNFGSAGIEI